MAPYLSLPVVLALAMFAAGSARGESTHGEPRLRVFERVCLETQADQRQIIALATAERWQVLPPDVTSLVTPVAGIRVRGWALPGSPLRPTLLVSAQIASLKTCAIQFFGGGALAFSDALMNWPSSTLMDMTDSPEKWTRVFRLDRTDGSMGVILTAERSLFGPFTVTAHEIRE